MFTEQTVETMQVSNVCFAALVAAEKTLRAAVEAAHDKFDGRPEAEGARGALCHLHEALEAVTAACRAVDQGTPHRAVDGE